MKTIYRYEVPIDDQWHDFKLTGHILHVGCRNLSRGIGRPPVNIVEFWAHHIEGNPEELVRLRVYGTGHDIPIASIHRGTAFSAASGIDPFVTPPGQFVWHLVQSIDEDLYAATTAVAHAEPVRG